MLRVAVATPLHKNLLTSSAARFGAAVPLRTGGAAPSLLVRRLATLDVDPQPMLKQVPSLPLFGSTITSYSKIPSMTDGDFNKWFRHMNAEYGPFYSVGIPGIGSGSRGTVYVVRDPSEMLKVLQQESKTPSGAVETIWPAIDFFKKENYSSVGLFERGEEWKRLRAFLQKDLLAPQSAREYLPQVIQGARDGSQRLLTEPIQSEPELLRFLNYCAMDMISGILFGGKGGMSDDDYKTFTVSSVESLGKLFPLLQGLQHNFARMLGMETKLMKEFNEQTKVAHDIARKRLAEFRAQLEAGNLTEGEKNSYYYKLLQRQPESDCTEEEAVELTIALMVAGVDTTAGKTAWNLLQLALNQDVQEELYREIKAAVDEDGGKLMPRVFDGSTVPLLAAFVRETHRCTPAIAGDLRKEISVPTEIYGMELPAGSPIMFDSTYNMMDPDLVEEPMTFNPKRWFKSEVEKRKGTPQAIVDHPFYSGPFSQGARRCPGSRVAQLEVQVMMASLLLDWKIEGPSMHWSEVKGQQKTTSVPVFPEGVRFVPRN